MPTSPSPLTDAERAGRALAHPLILQLSEPTVSALASIATSDAPTTLAERRLLRRTLDLLDAAEVALSRRAA